MDNHWTDAHLCGAGIIVSILIIKQGWGVLVGAMHQLTDGGVSAKTRTALSESLQPLLPIPHNSVNMQFTSRSPSDTQIEYHTENLLAIRELRAMRTGALMFVDLIADVPRALDVEGTSALEAQITRTLKAARKEIAEVRVKFRPVDEEVLPRHGHYRTSDQHHHN